MVGFGWVWNNYYLSENKDLKTPFAYAIWEEKKMADNCKICNKIILHSQYNSCCGMCSKCYANLIEMAKKIIKNKDDLKSEYVFHLKLTEAEKRVIENMLNLTL